MTGDVVAVRGDDLQKLLGLFALISEGDLPAILRVWIDPLDAAVKFKAGSGTWTRPYGQIEEVTA